MRLPDHSAVRASTSPQSRVSVFNLKRVPGSYARAPAVEVMVGSRFANALRIEFDTVGRVDLIYR